MTARGTKEKVRIGVSACLTGRCVRYDGGHKRDESLLEALAAFELVPVCPEVECGLPVPREPMDLTIVGTDSPESDRRLKLISAGGLDLTDRICTWAASRVEMIAAEDLAAFVFKSKSPSCAIGDARILDECDRVAAVRGGRGFFARAFMDRFPNLPVIDEREFSISEKRLAFLELLPSCL
jgi:uncharacterized protein YbbK (DUF523 family)